MDKLIRIDTPIWGALRAKKIESPNQVQILDEAVYVSLCATLGEGMDAFVLPPAMRQ